MNNLLQAFGESVDWVVIALLTIIFVVLVIFLILFVYFLVKNPKPEDDEKLTIEQNKITQFLDKQNQLHIKRYHNRCKVCGAKINKLTGKCTVCGTKNFDDYNKMH